MAKAKEAAASSEPGAKTAPVSEKPKETFEPAAPLVAFTPVFTEYTEKNGTKTPALVLGKRKVQKTVDGEKKYDENGRPIWTEKHIVLVMSSEASQPYKAEI